MPKKQRISMQGMGADAFFGLPVEKSETEETVGEKQIPVPQETGKTVPHIPVLPADQQGDLPVDQISSIPASQEAIAPSSQFPDKPANQQASTPGKQDFIKATYYIRPEQDLHLEQIRLQRRLKGEKIDKSALVRKAIDKLIEEDESLA